MVIKTSSDIGRSLYLSDLDMVGYHVRRFARFLLSSTSLLGLEYMISPQTGQSTSDPRPYVGGDRYVASLKPSV